MKQWTVAVATFVVLTILGCVMRTEHKIDAHITLDIRHIEEQAEDVLNYIEGRSEKLPALEEAEADAKAEEGNNATSWLRRALDALDPMPTAHAQELKASSPRVKEIADSLRKRHSKISSLKQKGCLGENNRGYVELRDCDELEDPERRNEVQQLLADENQDRKALYNEIARLNKEQDVTVSTVESIYALQRLERGEPGEWYQLPVQGKFFDEFKGSSLCDKLGAKCQPGAWVQLP